MCVFCLLLIVQSLPEFLVQNIGQNCLMYQIKYHLVIKLRKAISLTYEAHNVSWNMHFYLLGLIVDHGVSNYYQRIPLPGG